ncbi:hypothetical protein T265_02090 [Opisthorchis viverrini]|uniref:Rab-GAP TBC domain-containing protein n=1 Tax=Opisthorchis viverrini TaxID=6198 RepID=A0A075A7T4_OPIVI|nr:hypothetical protein T265_02090 [Opisthorchis viverrini]KER31720.1 hypothetical protein T265_02090 [Opisthorchis viverrini]
MERRGMMELKREHILQGITHDVDLRWLREYCITTYGLMDNDLRRKVWPMLVGQSDRDLLIYDDEILKSHTSHHQVQLDVNRLDSLLPPDITPEDKSATQAVLMRLIVSLLLDNPNLHYYQGFHDICYIFLSVLGENNARLLLNKILPDRFGLFMEASMDSTVEYMQLIFALLGHLRPTLTKNLEAVGLGPHFALAWIVTWFAHVLPEMDDVRRLFDLFLATDPLMLIYLSVAVIIRSDEEVQSNTSDFGMLHHTLLRLPKKHPVEELVRYSVKLYISVPPDQLLALGKQRHSVLSAISTEDSSVPSSYSGPSGSTFQTAFTWNGYLLACFVDLNADRQMDVVLLDAAGTDLFVSLAPSTRSSLTFGPTPSRNLPPPTLLFSPGLGEKIRSVAAADFNGDSLVDFMLLVSTARTGPYKVYLAYGVPGSTSLSFTIDASKPLVTTKSQPVICDLNSDAVADIFGETPSDERVIIYGGRNLTIRTIAYQGPPWSSLGYSAFGDVNGDTVPDIVVLVGESGDMKFQVYKRDPTPELGADVMLFDLPLSLRVAQQLTLGLFVLGDFDSDGTIDLLLPACTTINCVGGSSIFLFNFETFQWRSVDVEWEPKNVQPGYTWSLARTPADDLLLSALVGPTLGDFDLDGRPDIGMGLAYSAGTNIGTLPAVLLNQGVNSKTGHLTFQAYLLPGAKLPKTNTKLKQITFFDNGEKGVFDVFVASVDDADRSSVQLFLQQMVNDHYFVKVTVLNGLCSSAENCTDKRLPYGLPVPGQSSSYSTESASGGRLGFAGLMGVQSCCTALQLPSMRFGLGPFASYVERLTVAIPPDSALLRTFSIFGLIPNSEVFVNPYPHSDPDRWTAKLFLQPLYNMKVLYIAITLVCVCVVLVIIISVLQCLEVREDHKEKQKEAQRFHFDAM